jgi:hypothetical protein
MGCPEAHQAEPFSASLKVGHSSSARRKDVYLWTWMRCRASEKCLSDILRIGSVWGLRYVALSLSFPLKRQNLDHFTQLCRMAYPIAAVEGSLLAFCCRGCLVFLLWLSCRLCRSCLQVVTLTSHRASQKQPLENAKLADAGKRVKDRFQSRKSEHHGEYPMGTQERFSVRGA